ncbi:MAG: hypothetical protein BHV87_10065 [Clostridiales bacterium 36_14]|nr:MAG: hypothetical protein BHV87_10065 [Clostridiales bacterium 36_14]
MDAGSSKNMETKTSDNAENKSSAAEKVYQGLAKVANKLNEMLFDDDTSNKDTNKEAEKGETSNKEEKDTKKESDVNDSGENLANKTSDLLSKNISELVNKLFSDDAGDKPSGDDAEKDTNPEDSSEENPEDEKSEDENPEEDLSKEEKLKKIQDFIDGKIDFDEVKEIYAEYYADAVNSNKPWTWNETIPGGDALSAGQKKKIKECAQEKGLIPKVPIVEKDGKKYADFSKFTVFQCILDKEDWSKTDSEQFAKCNEQLKEAILKDPELAKQFTPEQIEQIMNGETPSGYTWHHSELDGTMQLVPFGIHNSTNHCGGRSEGHWADAPRH